MDKSNFIKTVFIRLEGVGLNINCKLTAHMRDKTSYVLNRVKAEIPETSYEVNLKGILPYLLTSDTVSRDDAHNHHIAYGSDGENYLCCFNITEKSLIPTVHIWLAHQVLFKMTGIDIVDIDSEFSMDNDFCKKARLLKSQNPSLKLYEIVYTIYNVKAKVEVC